VSDSFGLNLKSGIGAGKTNPVCGFRHDKTRRNIFNSGASGRSFDKDKRAPQISASGRSFDRDKRAPHPTYTALLPHYLTVQVTE
jgi:hypothetical protein